MILRKVYGMPIVVNFSPADAALIHAQATADNTSAEEYIRKITLKSVHNAEYLAKLERGIKQMHEGTGTTFTDAELKELIYGRNYTHNLLQRAL